MTETNNKRKFGAFGTSIFLHGALLLAIATMTVQLTLPEGNVTGTVEFNTITPQGSQLTTPNVAEEAQPESPEKIKRQEAPPPPKTLPVKPKPVAKAPKPEPEPIPEPIPDISEEAIKDIKPIDEGTMDVVQDRPEYPQHATTTTLEEAEEPAAAAAAVAETLPTKEEQDETPLPAPPVVGQNAEKTVQAGNDAVDLKGQERVENQNYGTINGVPNADLHLRQIPGNKQPTYPWMARLRRLEGEVVLNLHVSSTGKVTEVRLAQSTHEVFSKECLEAVKGWKFQTPIQPGWYAKPFRFQLKGDEKEKPTLLRRKNN